MQVRYLPAFIVLLAAAITSVINIVNNIEMLAGLKRLLLVIIIFYIIGLIAKVVIKKVITPKQKIVETEEIPKETPQSKE